MKKFKASKASLHRREILAAVGGLFLLLCTAILIPWHMDEFVMYHRLACQELAQQVNIYRESCFDYPISFLGIDFYRSYQYTGIASSILAMPFFLVVKSLWLNYLIGLIFIILIFWGIIRSFNLKITSGLKALVFFPIVFTVLHDGGPVRLSLVAMAWTPYFFRKFLNRNRLKSLWSLSPIILLWMISAEDKPFFIFILPGVILFTLAAIVHVEDLSFLVKHKFKIALGMSVASLFAISIFFILRVGELSYFAYLRSISTAPTPEVLQETISTDDPESSIQTILFKKIMFIFVWAFYPHRTMDLENFYLGNLAIPYPGISTPTQILSSALFGIGILLILVGYYLLFRYLIQNFKSKMALVSYLILSASALLWLIPSATGGWTSHHYVFMQVAILTALLLVGEKSEENSRVVGAIFTVVTSLSLVVSILTPVNIQASREIEKVSKFAIEISSEKSIMHCAYWGCYHQLALMNSRNVPVAFATSEVDILKLESHAVLNGLSILTICAECSTNSLNENFPNSTVTQIETKTQDWKLFTVKSD